jgi:hypothetical protein
MAGSPSFGKTFFTSTLHIILHKNSIEQSLMLLRLSCFGSICIYPLFLNFKNCTKSVTTAISSVTIHPVFDEREIWIRSGGGSGQVMILPLVGCTLC